MVIRRLSAKSVKPNSNWKPKKFKSVKPKWMKDMEGVKCLPKKKFMFLYVIRTCVSI